MQNTVMLFLPLPQNPKQNEKQGSHDPYQSLRINGAVVLPGTDMIDRHRSLTRGTDIWSLLVTVQLLTDPFNKHSTYTSTMNTDKYDYPRRVCYRKKQQYRSILEIILKFEVNKPK
jgi:hypothetical protein